ncbi:MAG TPA: glycosyltransferase family 39 protein [Thermodesulfovibrionales bacterium]|nr:glycosyltransferase family 39 protein [Thermodesulfovibrionales bacterium]
MPFQECAFEPPGEGGITAITFEPHREKISSAVLISLLTLSAFAVLFVFRSADDNRLTSWQWVFDGVDVTEIYLILLLGIILSYLLSKVWVRVRRPALVLFSLSFAASVVFWSEPEVIVDTARYFTQAKTLEVYGIGHFFREWGRGISAWTDLPLVPFLYGLIFKFVGETRLYVQIFTTVLFSLTVILTYRIGKILWNEETGFSAGLLLLGIPYVFTQIPLMLVDIPTMFFLTLSVFAVTEALWCGSSGMVVLSSFSLFLSFFSKFSTWPMLSILVVIFLICQTRIENAAAGSCMGKTAVIIALALLSAGTVILLKFDVFSEQVRLLMRYQGPGLRRWGESFLSTFFFQIHPFITFSALYSAWIAYRRRDPRYLIISWGVILVILFQVKRIRYILPLFPMIALMAAYGLQEIRDREVKRFLIFCILFSSITVAGFAYLPFTEKMSAVNLKMAGEFLDSLEGETVEVATLQREGQMINPAAFVPILDLYTHKKIRYRDGGSLFPDREERDSSPLRFTWEYKSPDYYVWDKDLPKRGIPLVVIAGGETDILPDSVAQRVGGSPSVRRFQRDENVFSEKTFVTIYAPEGGFRNRPKIKER